MAEDRNYWQRRIDRRTALRAAGLTAGGVAAAALIGCSSKDEPTPTTGGNAAPATAQPKKGGELRVALAADTYDGLNPAVGRGGGDYQVLYTLFDTLVALGPDLKIKPALAESYEVIDPLTIKFALRKGVKWHDGTPFTAQDVKFTIDFNKDPKKGYTSGQVSTIDRVETPDEHTAVFKLSALTASILSILADRPGMMMPKSADANLKAYNEKPITTGPVKLDTWVKESYQRYVRNEDYWGEKTHFDSIRYDIIPDDSARFANLRTGNTDISFIGPSDVDAARKATDRMTQVEWPSLAVARGAINIAMYPLNDVRIRKALAFATNYKGFLDSLWFGIGNVANGMETPASWAWNSKVPKMREDLAEAKKLLSAAGEGEGKNIWPMVTPNSADSIATCELLKSQWERVGIKIDIKPLPSAEAGTAARDQKFAWIPSGGWSGRSDPDLTYYENFHSKGSFNRASFNKEYKPDAAQQELDRELVKARGTYNFEERKASYHRISELVVDNMMALFWIERVNELAHSKRVKNFVPWGDAKLRNQTVWLDS
jgi:peptide/nickel transport system substrate-binding protein